MSKLNSIFQLLVALFFGVALVFFLTYERMWNEALEPATVVTWLVIGLVLFLISWGISSLAMRKLNGLLKKADLEKKELKAMVFDLERAVKLDKVDKKIETNDQEDKESSSIKPRENFK